MANHEIEIDVAMDENRHANFTYHPAVKRVSTDDTVRWFCRRGPFAIMFKESSPSEEIDLQGTITDDGVWVTPTVTILDDARGHFHYAVAVSFNDFVFLDAACPEIIVRGR